MKCGLKQIVPIALAVCAAILCAQPSSPERIGKQADGSFLLPTGWRINPAGEQIPLDTLPISTAVSKNGKFLLVLSAGSDPPSISVFALDGMKQIQRVPVADAWLGMALSPDGKFVYVGGGSKYSVYEFSFSEDGHLSPARQFEIAPGTKPGSKDFIGGIAISPDGRTIYAADLYRDSVDAIDTQSGRVTGRIKTGRRPYTILFAPDGESFFVSSWADGAVYEYETKTGSEITRIRLGPHATGMVLSDRKIQPTDGVPAQGQAQGPTQSNTWRYRLFIAASNTNSVFVVGVSDSKEMKLLNTIDVSLTARQPAGMLPSALALSPDQVHLFIACSGANAVAVADISGESSQLEGLIPAGWYPTSVRMLTDGRVLILNGHGAAAGPRKGTLSVIAPLTNEALDAYTKTALALFPYRDSQLAPPKMPGGGIEHVIYIVTGRTGGPNESKLAGEFVRFDNFYANGGTAAENENWAVAGIAPDYTELLSPSYEAHRLTYNGFEGGEPANAPPAGYLWSNAASAGLSVRNYGEFGANKNGWNDFLKDLKQFETSSDMPRLTVLKLEGNTDFALGAVVEAVSHSAFWPKTAIFVTSGAADGSYRSAMLAISPYTRRGNVDHTMHNQSSVVRTIEIILGLRPMTMFDASARPLTNIFGATANADPYTPEKP
ncbi:MAG TPA: bifunctional YncE family protein/alkaline phosphatase family protein [Bryobacteraceae bacterium]|nr:bifunctional YncE family protein/alkaline phosphatase family protein [Bryobacteraceae bacterium]